MRIKLILATVVLVATSASAGPVLLGSFGGFAGSGATGLTDPRFQLGILVTRADEQTEAIGLGDILFSDQFLSDGQSGVFVFRADTNPLFLPFARLLQNGTDDLIVLVSVWGQMTHGGIRGDLESFWLGRDPTIGEIPDFSGNQLDSIRLVITDLRVEPFFVNEQDGLLATFDYVYEFYGSPIPEPGTAVLLVLGAFGVLLRRSCPRGSLADDRRAAE